ncbi:hypothetical protein ACOSP7_007976 [Xanthoceras sorbifolium]
MVIRNHCGLVMGSSWQCIAGSLSPQCAEAAASFRGLRFATDLGIWPSIIESNAEAVVNLININRDLMPLSEIGIFVKDIRVLLSELNIARVSFVPRLANSVAHSLAKFAVSLLSDGFLVDCIPPSVESCVLSDLPG